MRNLWYFVSGAIVVIGLGSVVYFVFPKSELPTTPTVELSNAQPSSHPDAVPLPASNPLLNATRKEFDRWLPSYPLRCGAILFEGAAHRPPDPAFCLREVTKRVAGSTGIQLSESEVLDPRVKARWTIVMQGG